MVKKSKQSDKEYNNLAIGIGCGLAVGTALGVTVFDNIAIGVGFGLAIGTAIGVAMGDEKDKKTKKK